MKKLGIALLSLFLLAGCGVQETFETVDDLQPAESCATAAEISLVLPEEAAMETLESDGVTGYQCDGYTIMLQTFSGGDLNRTVKQICGYEKEDLSIIKTLSQGVDRYDWVFTTVEEEGEQMFRTMLLDDGHYHYTVTAKAPARTAGALQETWNNLFSCVSLINTD